MLAHSTSTHPSVTTTAKKPALSANSGDAAPTEGSLELNDLTRYIYPYADQDKTVINEHYRQPKPKQNPKKPWGIDHQDYRYGDETEISPSHTLYTTLEQHKHPYSRSLSDALNKVRISVTHDQNIKIQLTNHQNSNQKEWLQITWTHLSPEYQDLLLKSLEYRSNFRAYNIFFSFLGVAASIDLIHLMLSPTVSPAALLIIYATIGCMMLLSFVFCTEEQPSSLSFKLINTVLLGILTTSLVLMPLSITALSIATAPIITLNTALLIWRYFKNQKIKQSITALKGKIDRKNNDSSPFYHCHSEQQYSDYIYCAALNNNTFYPFQKLKIIISRELNDRSRDTLCRALKALKLRIHHTEQGQLLLDIDGPNYASEHITLEWAHVHQEYRNIVIEVFKSKTCHKWDYAPFILFAMAGASIPICVHYQMIFTAATLASHTLLFLGIMGGLGLVSLLSIFRHQSQYAKKLQGLNLLILVFATFIGYSALNIPLPILTITGVVFAVINACHTLGLGIYDLFSGIPENVARLQIGNLEPECAADIPPTTTTDATAQAAYVNPLSAPIAAHAAAHVAPPNGSADLGADITETTDTNDRRELY